VIDDEHDRRVITSPTGEQRDGDRLAHHGGRAASEHRHVAVATHLGPHDEGQHGERGDLDAAARRRRPGADEHERRSRTPASARASRRTARSLNPAVRGVAPWNHPPAASRRWRAVPSVPGLPHSNASTTTGPATSSAAVANSVMLGVEAPLSRARWRSRSSTRTGNPSPPMMNAAETDDHDQRVGHEPLEAVGVQRDAGVVERRLTAWNTAL
jgi:hypothetical protein